MTAYKIPHTLADGHGLMLLVYKVTVDIPEVILSSEHCGYAWVGRDELHSVEQEAAISADYRDMVCSMSL